MTVKTELKTEKTMHNERHEITVDQDILSFFLDIGEIMIMAGAEISRVRIRSGIWRQRITARGQMSLPLLPC